MSGADSDEDMRFGCWFMVGVTLVICCFWGLIIALGVHTNTDAVISLGIFNVIVFAGLSLLFAIGAILANKNIHRNKDKVLAKKI